MAKARTVSTERITPAAIRRVVEAVRRALEVAEQTAAVRVQVSDATEDAS